mgnify:CR=1 FL=1
MRNRYSTLLLILAAVAIAVTGCDQSTQTAEPANADRYIISMKNSAVGDAGGIDIQSSTQTVMVPDTIDYAVQGFTVNKTYDWTLNDSEIPVEGRSNSTYEWEAREGEFVSLMFTLDDPSVNVDPTAGETVNSLAVNSPDDDINQEVVDITAVIPQISTQLARLPSSMTGGSFSQVELLGSSSGVGAFLQAGAPGGNQSYTVFAPNDAAIGALGAVPTQATDADEPTSSSVRADLLKYHALASKVGSGDLSDGSVPTLFGDQTIEVDAGAGTVNGTAIVGTDFPTAGNGFVHTIEDVLLPSTASVDFTDRTVDSLSAGGVTSDPDTITVDGSFIPDGGGFIVLHDSTALADQGAIPSTVGVSGYIGADSVANNVEIPVDQAISDTTTIGAMPHEDTNGNQTYDFETSGGTQDGPYTLEGSPILDYAIINIE